MPAKQDNDAWLNDIDLGFASEDEALETKQNRENATPSVLDTPVDAAAKLSENIDAELSPFLEVRKRMLRFQTLLQVTAVLLYTIGTALFVDDSGTPGVTPAVTNTTN